jgi:crotonobetainyl-CoA:carnitine CoA-transferase CaiB-like acyl-CoA transferase
MPKVLSGIRVLDFTDALAGPYCTRYMADCGAEVLNIEKPGGKQARSIPYFHKGVGLDFLYNHCGKKSVGIDMKREGSRELVLNMARVCDVVMENFRPGVMRDFKLTYEDFKNVNPSIIMCSISGWGQSGPRAEQMAADLSIQSVSGILDLTGDPNGRPSLVGFPVTDILAGLNAFGAICAALYHRTVTGKGDYIDIAMADCAINCLHQAVGMHTLTEGKVKLKRSGAFNNDMPSWGIFKGKDGYIAISAATKIGWDRLTELMGKPELAGDPRFETREARLKNNDAAWHMLKNGLRTLTMFRMWPPFCRAIVSSRPLFFLSESSSTRMSSLNSGACSGNWNILSLVTSNSLPAPCASPIPALRRKLLPPFLPERAPMKCSVPS